MYICTYVYKLKNILQNLLLNLVQFCRWSLLLTGVVYGIYHQRRLSKKENALREQDLKEKPIRDAKLAAEKKRLQDGKKR